MAALVDKLRAQRTHQADVLPDRWIKFLRPTAAQMPALRGGFDVALVARQCVDLEMALRAYTINGAFQLRMEDRIGSIEVGKHADLVVLERDLFSVAPEEIHTVGVRLTMMDGRITFAA